MDSSLSTHVNVTSGVPFGVTVLSGTAGMIANAATRSLINGTDFGDNIMAALPDTVSSLLSNLAAGIFGGPVTDDSVQEQAGKIALGPLPAIPLTAQDLNYHVPTFSYDHIARQGESISQILGTSNPGAIGAFMQANNLSSSAIVAGKNYIVPDASSYDDPGAEALGQNALNVDNARLAENRAEQAYIDAKFAELDRAIGSLGRHIGRLTTGHDGYYSEGSTTGLPVAVVASEANRSISVAPDRVNGLSEAVEMFGTMIDSQELLTTSVMTFRGEEGIAWINRLSPLYKSISIPATALSQGLEGISEVRRGVGTAPATGIGVVTNSVAIAGSSWLVTCSPEMSPFRG